MPFEHPQMSSVETKDLRLVYADLEKAKAALTQKDGNTRSPLANAYLSEAETLLAKMLKLHQPKHQAVD